MEPLVNGKEICFKRFLYTVVIPKQQEILFQFWDVRSITGHPLILIVKAKDFHIRSPLGFFGWFLYFVSNFLATGKASLSTAPTAVCFPDKIRSFLSNLQSFGYDIRNSISELNRLEQVPFPKALLRGTSEWKTDKRRLVTIIFVFFSCLIFFGYFSSDEMSIISLLVSLIVLFVICLIVYTFLTRMKEVAK